MLVRVESVGAVGGWWWQKKGRRGWWLRLMVVVVMGDEGVKEAVNQLGHSGGNERRCRVGSDVRRVGAREERLR